MYSFNEGVERKRLWSQLVSLKSFFFFTVFLDVGKGFQCYYICLRVQTLLAPKLCHWMLKNLQNVCRNWLYLIMLSQGHCIHGLIIKKTHSWPKSLIECWSMLIGCLLFLIQQWIFFPLKFLPTVQHLFRWIKLHILLLSHLKFFNFWTKHHEFQATVEKSWMKLMNGTPMVLLQQKLKRLKQCLRSFNKDYFFIFAQRWKLKGQN